MLKRFSKYVFQSVAGMIGVSVYVLADTFFISVYAGADGLAVLNLILPVYGLIYAIGSMIGIGSATRYGISKAKGERADYYFTQAIAWSVLISIPFVLLGIFIPDKCLTLLGADAGLVALGKTYLRIILIGTPFFMSNFSGRSWICRSGTCNSVLSDRYDVCLHAALFWKKMSHRIQMEENVCPTSDLMLSARCIRVRGRNFFRRDRICV